MITRAVPQRLFLGLALLLAAALPRPSFGQSDGLLRLDDDIHRFLLRQQTKGLLDSLPLDHRPLSTYDLRVALDTLSDQASALSPTDRTLLARLLHEQTHERAAWLHGLAPSLYANGTDFFSVEGPDYALQINPLAYLALGTARAEAPTTGDSSHVTWQNTRGLRLTGHVGEHVFFDTSVEENQQVAPVAARPLLRERLGHAYYWNDRTLDYWRVRGLVGYRSDHFELRLGRFSNHWGPGHTSLLLSDYAPAYDQLQIRTSFWRLQYTNVYAVLTNRGGPRSDTPASALPPKYGVFHRLAITLPGRVDVGLFEGVVITPDELGEGSYFAFLNPLIFYRAVDIDVGSPGNVVVGSDVRWTARPGLALYGQLLLDEFVLSELGDATWRNKWGVTAGLHAVDVGLPGLALRAEYTRIRPYTYSNRTAGLGYVHQRGLLGHPIGPNAEDYSLFLDYRPTTDLRAAVDLSYTRRGRNTTTTNYGSNALEPYGTRVGDTDIRLLQGVRQNVLLAEAHGGYQLLPDLWLEAALRYHTIYDAERGRTSYVMPYLLLRWGLPFQSLRY